MQLVSFLCAIVLPLLWFTFAIYTSSAVLEGAGLLGTHLANSSITWGIVLLAVLFAYGSVLALGRPSLKK